MRFLSNAVAGVRRLLGPGSLRDGLARRRVELSRKFSVIYAVGDVHGCVEQLHRLEEKIVRDAGRHDGDKLIVMLGDYVDRGADSSAVLQHLIEEPPQGFQRVCLCGNHDDAMLSFVRDPLKGAHWLDYGGDRTLRSYGIDVDHLRNMRLGQDQMIDAIRYSIPEAHVEFLEQLPVLLTTPGYVFVHAGVRRGIALTDQSDDDLMWIRDEFIGKDVSEFGVVVHGHTPSPEPEFVDGRIGIDTGAYMSGRLSAVRICDEGVSFMSSDDDRS